MIHYPMADAEPSAEDYEAQRQANIKANLELMMSLGLYQTSSQFNPAKPATPKSKPITKAHRASSASSTSNDGDARALPKQRPKRVTRSVSRQLETPQRSGTGRGMKRTSSDTSIYSYPYSARKVSRLDRDDVMGRRANKFKSNSDDDEYRPTYNYKRSSGRGPINPSRFYRDPSSLQRNADRLGIRVHDPKTFGSIPGIAIGTIWEKRMDCSTDAVHAPTVAGISGNETDGCWSICLSGGYEDDIDLGESFTYTGSGGRDLKGTVNNPKNLRTAPQSSDQRWEGKNAALRMSVQTRRPVRVVRGYKANNRYAPKEQGYVYSGLYRVTKAWMERGQAGFMVCKFKFERCAGQDPLPTFDHEDEDEEEEQEQEQEQAVEEDGGEFEEVSAHSMRVLNRSKPNLAAREQKESVDLTRDTSPTSTTQHPTAISPSPTPSIRSTCSSKSHHPILKSPTGFDRASYIIISDDSDDEDPPATSEQEEVEVEQVLLHLEVEPKATEELLAPPKRRRKTPNPRPTSRIMTRSKHKRKSRR